MEDNYAFFVCARSFIYVNPICVGLIIKGNKRAENGQAGNLFSIQYCNFSAKKHFIPTFGASTVRLLKDNSKKIKLGFMVFWDPNWFGTGSILRFERSF